jgi:hypothetical protein
MECSIGNTAEIAKQIADRNDLNVEQTGTGFRFWRIE